MSIQAEVFNISPKLVEDETINDSDKAFTVPTGKIWKVQWIYVELTTTADVGDRRIAIHLRDEEDDILLQVLALNVQTASTTETYVASPGIGDVSETLGTQHLLPIPLQTILPAGYDIRVYDINAVQPAADDMEIHMMIQEVDA